MSLFTDPRLETLIPHAGTTTDPMSIWEEVEKPQPTRRPDAPGSTKPAQPTPQKPSDKKS